MGGMARIPMMLFFWLAHELLVGDFYKKLSGLSSIRQTSPKEGKTQHNMFLSCFLGR